MLTGLLVLCCAIAGTMSVMYVKTGRMDRDERLAVAGMSGKLCNILFPTGVASADSAETLQSVPLGSSQSSQSPPTAGAWLTATARSIATFFSSLYTTVRDFFVSGQALKLLETVAQTIEDFAVRLFAPLASAILPLLQRVFPSFSLTRELLAVWIFWIAVVLVLLVLILLLRPRHTTRKRLPKASPRAAGQGENAIEFGLVEQGPAPEPAGLSEQPVQQEAAEAPQKEETVAPESVASEQPASAPTSSPSIPEISLEPLGFYEEETRPEEPAAASTVEAPPAAIPVPPIVELASVEPESGPSLEAAEPAEVPAVEVPPEALLEAPASEPQAPEPIVEAASAPFVEPDLTPIGQVTPSASAQPEEAVREPEVPAEVLAQPLETSEPAATTTEEAVSEENIPASTQPETLVAEPEPQPSPAPETSAAASTDLQAAQPVPSGADVLSHMLEEEGAFQNAVKLAVTTGPAEAAPETPETPETQPAAEPSLFTGDIDLDTLVQEGVVSDAAAVGQLFGGGYRSEIAKLAISAKDLQNVPEEIRNVVKLTIVALSPIELSIARDVAMRLEAPGFVGEALLVAKKMGYQNYLTTYKNISRNYKDVIIVETASLKPPQRTSADSGDGLISFS